MELSTFINPQSNPPPFSLFGREDELLRGFPSVLNLFSSSQVREDDEKPIVDRFGFIVDAKYGLKLMRESRIKKKKMEEEEQKRSRAARELDESALVPPEPEGSALMASTHSEMVLELSPRASSDSTTQNPSQQPSSSPMAQASPRPAQPRCGTARESSDFDHTPMMTTALPIKSQVDVEAELVSLREALGLPTPPEDKKAKSSSVAVVEPVDSLPASPRLGAQKAFESSAQSIKRLLAQLNEMQNMLEQSQMQAWGKFIAKRKSKLVKASTTTATTTTTSHVLTNTVSSAAVSPADGNGKKNQSTGTVSPESVGAFLGLTVSVSNGASGLASSPTGTVAGTFSLNGTGTQMNSKSSSSAGEWSGRDLITCHDDNLIGIASMGLSNDNNKKALKDDWAEFKGLVTKGIPISLRPKIWLECSGASEVKEPGYYQDLLNLHKGEEGLCLNQIECDVTRTLPTNVYFGGDGPGVNKLRRVLAAMSWHNPVVGYCQGMNMVAATLLLTIPSEEDAFWILVCIVDKILPTDYYTSHLLTSQADQRVLKDLVDKYLPELWDHFDALDVELPAITFGWFLSLFADALPIQTLLRVFDLFLIDGSVLLFRISLALLKINQTAILSHDSPASLYAYMRGPMTLGSHHADKLISVAMDHFREVKEITVQGLREKHVKELKVEMGLM